MRKLLSGVLAVLLAVSAAVPALAAKADEVHIICFRHFLVVLLS